jgi:hypothetical protein
MAQTSGGFTVKLATGFVPALTASVIVTVLEQPLAVMIVSVTVYVPAVV